jgi:hypothetical protein
VCLLGASWARQHILEAHKDAKLTVYAIWMPMLAGDARSAWDANVLDDPRVVNLWDGDRVAGTWLADHRTAGIGDAGYPVWDAYFAFDKSAKWNAEPDPPVAAGSAIIDNVSGLERGFVPLLHA